MYTVLFLCNPLKSRALIDVMLFHNVLTFVEFSMIYDPNKR